MAAMELMARRRFQPLWLVVASLGGVGWNVFGVVQFLGSVGASEASLMAAGMTPEQAAVMTGYPVWMTVAFAVGVFGGLLGSLMLLIRRGPASPVLAISLGAYVALWIGDAVHGVFAALGMPQVIILTVVVAIAAALFAISRTAAARN